MMPGAIALFTREPVDEIRENRGTGNWVASAERVRQYSFVVLVRNRQHPSSPSDVEHGTAFLVGRISATREVTETAANKYPRIFIAISEYALVDVADSWSKSQNPVWFTNLETLGIEETSLKFEPMPHEHGDAASGELVSKDNVLADMKRQIGLLFNVPGSAIEISIRL
jgi:hypothetical protein